MKKATLVLVLFLASFLFVGGCITQGEKDNKDEIVIENEESKVDEKGEMETYKNSEIGFSFMYPKSITFLQKDEYNEDTSKSYIKVRIKEIGKPEHQLDLSKEEEMKTIEELSSGKFGVEQGFALKKSEKVIPVGHIFAQDYVVLSRFEVCSVVLERSLLFYFNNKQITITYYGPVDVLKKAMSGYFVINKENCGEEDIRDFDGNSQDRFYQALSEGKGLKDIQSWFNEFSEVVNTVVFDHK